MITDIKELDNYDYVFGVADGKFNLIHSHERSDGVPADNNAGDNEVKNTTPINKSGTDWAQYEDILKRVPSKILSEAFNCSIEEVDSQKRAVGVVFKEKELDLPVLKEPTKRPRIDWSNIDFYLGMMSDTDLADRVGVSSAAITNRRNKFKIPKYSVSSKLEDGAFDNIIVSTTIKDAAAILNVPEKNIKNHKKSIDDSTIDKLSIDEIIPLLGKMSDIKLASTLKTTPYVIGRLRRMHNIGAYNPVSQYEHLLGKIPDADIATLFNVTVSSVASARTKRGISNS